jgi:hypothetical protein
VGPVDAPDGHPLSRREPEDSLRGERLERETADLAAEPPWGRLRLDLTREQIRIGVVEGRGLARRGAPVGQHAFDLKAPQLVGEDAARERRAGARACQGRRVSARVPAEAQGDHRPLRGTHAG